MNVILLERVEKLGAIGDVVTVKDGYARNFLLPRKKALRANEANKKVFEANRARIEAENANRRAEAEVESKTFENATVTLIRQASNVGQLYGSVAVRDWSRRWSPTATRSTRARSCSTVRSRRSACTTCASRFTRKWP